MKSNVKRTKSSILHTQQEKHIYQIERSFKAALYSFCISLDLAACFPSNCVTPSFSALLTRLYSPSPYQQAMNFVLVLF